MVTVKKVKELVSKIFEGCKVTESIDQELNTLIKAYAIKVEHIQLQMLAALQLEHPFLNIEMKRSGIYVVIIFSAK